MQSLLAFGVTGSEGESGYSSVMRKVAVQKLLLDIADAPRTPEFLDAALEGPGVEREKLEKLGLVRRRDGEYMISFPLFTSDDVRTLRSVAERVTQSLVAAFVARQPYVESLLWQYDAPGVDPKAVAYLVLGCFSLDWDGLDLTAEKGYRSVSDVALGGGVFTPWAEERSDLTLKGIYWGSHNDGEQHFRFTSFGDHFSIPRYAFPDVLWHWRLPTHAASEVPDPLKPTVEKVMQQAVRGMMRQVGRIMFALRHGERTLARLASVSEMDEHDAEDLLTLLVKLDYITWMDGRYFANVPVLAVRDGPVVRALRRVGWELMDAWLSAHYGDVKAQLCDLTAVRYGVPYGAVFTQVWHYLFGTANGRLVEAGLFADPYAQSRRRKGFIPAVWHQILRDLR